MSDERRDPQGRLIIHLTPTPDLYALRKAAEILDREPTAEAKDRFTSSDLRFWDYRVRGVPLTLQWERELGLSLTAGDTAADVERFTRELAESLRAELERAGLAPGP